MFVIRRRMLLSYILALLFTKITGAPVNWFDFPRQICRGFSEDTIKELLDFPNFSYSLCKGKKKNENKRVKTLFEEDLQLVAKAHVIKGYEKNLNSKTPVIVGIPVYERVADSENCDSEEITFEFNLWKNLVKSPDSVSSSLNQDYDYFKTGSLKAIVIAAPQRDEEAFTFKLPLGHLGQRSLRTVTDTQHSFVSFVLNNKQESDTCIKQSVDRSLSDIEEFSKIIIYPEWFNIDSSLSYLDGSNKGLSTELNTSPTYSLKELGLDIIINVWCVPKYDKHRLPATDIPNLLSSSGSLNIVNNLSKKLFFD